MNKLFFLAVLSISASLASCQNQTSKGSSKQVNVTIPVDEFDKKLNETKDVQLVDVRTP